MVDTCMYNGILCNCLKVNSLCIHMEKSPGYTFNEGKNECAGQCAWYPTTCFKRGENNTYLYTCKISKCLKQYTKK